MRRVLDLWESEARRDEYGEPRAFSERFAQCYPDLQRGPAAGLEGLRRIYSDLVSGGFALAEIERLNAFARVYGSHDVPFTSLVS
jgi:hypothetical protein